MQYILYIEVIHANRRALIPTCYRCVRSYNTVVVELHESTLKGVGVAEEAEQWE